MKKNIITQIIIILLISIVTISFVEKTQFQADIFFSIAVGDRIEEFGFEEEDKLVWHEGLRYIYLRWGFDVIANAIYDSFGLNGIQVFVVCFSILQMILYYFVLNSITKKKIFSAICTLLMIPGLNQEFVGRAHLLSFVLFIIEYYCIEKLVETNKNRYFVALLILPLLLVNIHASTYPLYFIFYLPYIAEFILSKLKLKVDESSKIVIEKRNITKLIVLMPIGVVLGFCSPCGIDAYKYVFTVMDAISATFITEMQPLNLLDDATLSICICLYMAIMAFTKTKVRVVDCFLVLGITLMSLNTVRYDFFFYLIASICIFRALNDLLNDYDIKFDFIDVALKKMVAIIVIILIVLSSCNKIIVKYSQDYITTMVYPVNAAQYILNNLNVSEMKIYNHFNFGGYLELLGIPVFLDSRAEMYAKEFNDTTILEDWCAISSGEESYKKIFNKYGITHALLYKTELINNYIKEDKEWEIIYQDDIFVLYERVEK